MVFRKLSFGIAIRTAVLMLSLGVIVTLFNQPAYQATTLLVTVITLAQIWSLYRFISRTNIELARFLDAARYGDLEQRFELSELGAGFEELGTVFTDILQRFQQDRFEQEQTLRHLKAMVEHIPVPLISIHHNNSVTLWNNNARRLFGSYHVGCLNDLQQFGEDFYHQINVVQNGERRLASFSVDGMEQQLTISATEIIQSEQTERLISMQDIGSELDGVQLQAWQELVRVLTHEIMNSITPVASLAKTAVDLVEDAKQKITQHPEVVAELEDVAEAVSTVARRSDGLMQFVGSYRRLTRLPPPQKQQIEIHKLFQHLKVLFAQQWQQKSISLTIAVRPLELEVTADPEMIEQLLINLLKNAEQALTDNGVASDNAVVNLSARLNNRGRISIQIADNGPGVPTDIARQIFVPFFTTKREGSGVGLALARQVMIAHGGTIKQEHSEQGGALFTLIL